VDLSKDTLKTASCPLHEIHAIEAAVLSKLNVEDVRTEVVCLILTCPLYT